VSDFKRLLVWQKAHKLALHVYQTGTAMRRSHDLALRSQMIRAAMSIPTNVVEGRRQRSEKEFGRFLRIALNSACELEYHIMMARDIGAITDSQSVSLLNEVIEVRKRIHGLLNKLGQAPNSQSPNASMKAGEL
jgi:four helix bundle protein